MLKKILHEASRFKTNAIRFWNWRKKPFPRPRLTLEETITEKVKINELCSDIINLSFVNFPATPIKPWERRIVGKTFFKCIFSQETIEDFTFNNCHFTECVFNGAKIIDVEFHDCTFNECFFYKTKFTSTYIDPPHTFFYRSLALGQIKCKPRSLPVPLQKPKRYTSRWIRHVCR